jgi:HK97 family phage major capsid protein
MASEVAKRLRDRRLNVWNEAKKIAEDAAGENRSFTPEEQGRWDAMQEEMQTLDVRIGAVLDTEKRAKEADNAFEALQDRPREKSGQAGPGGVQLEEIRKWARGDQGAPRAIEIRRAAEGPINYRTLTTVGAGSSSIIPTDFYDQLIAHLIEVSGVMQCGPTVLNTGGGETLQVPKTTAHSFASTTGAAATQAQPLPTSDPAFSMQTLSAYKYGILLQVARELIDDTAVDLLGYLAMQAGRALGNNFGNDLVNGSGAGAPSGILTGATVGVTGGTTGQGGSPTYANLIDLEYSVIAPYRQSRSCYWLAADKTIGGFRKIVDSTGRPVWEPSAVLGSPDLLLGKPLVADPFMPAVAVSALTVAFGDFSQYFVRLVGGVRFERSDDFAFGSDVVTFRAILRGDGTLVDRTGAIKVYKGASA